LLPTAAVWSFKYTIDYDFSFTNNFGAGTELFYGGVSLPNPVTGSIVYPNGWTAPGDQKKPHVI
jgi:hypothetical protein